MHTVRYRHADGRHDPEGGRRGEASHRPPGLDDRARPQESDAGDDLSRDAGGIAEPGEMPPDGEWGREDEVSSSRLAVARESAELFRCGGPAVRPGADT